MAKLKKERNRSAYVVSHEAIRSQPTTTNSVEGTNYESLKTRIATNVSIKQREQVKGALFASNIVIQNTGNNLDTLLKENSNLREIKGLMDNYAPKDIDKDTVTQILLSCCEFQYSEPTQYSTADLRDLSNAYTEKITNIKFSLGNFLKYVSEMTVFVLSLSQKDIIGIIVSCLELLKHYRHDEHVDLDFNTACFLLYLYKQTLYTKEVNYDNIRNDFVEYYNREYPNNNRIVHNDVDKIINTLIDLKCISNNDEGVLQIIEKIQL